MATQPQKPAPAKHEAAKPDAKIHNDQKPADGSPPPNYKAAAKDDTPAPHDSEKKPGQTTGGKSKGDADDDSVHGERPLTDDDSGYLHDERLDPDNPDHDRFRDRKTGEIPGTPYTAPEGVGIRAPGPGEPGGPGAGPVNANLAATTTVADEQRQRSDRYASHGVDAVKSENDDRDPDNRAANTKQVPGVSPTAGVTPGEPGSTWKDSTRSTPAARNAQSKGAP